MSIMANISIDFDSKKNEIYLLGDIEALQKNRFAWRYVKDYLHPQIMEDCLIIPIEDNEPFSVMSNISAMLQSMTLLKYRVRAQKRWFGIIIWKNKNLPNFLKKRLIFEIMSVMQQNLKNLLRL